MNTENIMKAEQTDRQTLLSVLSKSTKEATAAVWGALDIHPEYTLLKQPEIGMVMVKAKAGGNGSAFNMGEMTVTRTVLQLSSREMGYGYTAGRDKEKSITMAMIDACYQVDAWRQDIHDHVLLPLKTTLSQAHNEHKNKVDQTKVNFFTMVRGE